MWNLIAKDLYLQRVRMTLVVVLAGAATVAMFIAEHMSSGGLYPAILMFTFGVTFTFALFSCSHEERNNSVSFLRSLPVPARTVVNSKFTAMIVLEAVVLIFLYVLICLGKMAGILAVNAFSVDIRFFVLAGLVVLLFNSIVLLIYFRWGYNRIQLVYTISYIVIFNGIMLLGRIVPKITYFFPGISPGQAAILGTALVLLVVFLCWKGSVSVLTKKDLN